MKLYIAGSSKEIDAIADYMRRLRSVGIQITHDWTKDIRKEAAKGKSDAALTHEEMRHYAAYDLLGVEAADHFWLLIPENGSVGTWVELGAALARNTILRPSSILPPIIVISGDITGRIFAALADEVFTEHDAAFKWFRERAPDFERCGP